MSAAATAGGRPVRRAPATRWPPRCRRCRGAACTLTNLIAFLPGILAAVPEFWQRHLVAFLPTGAAASLAGGGSPASLPLPAAWAVVAAWAAVLALVAGLVLDRRDA
ncbi:MAG TPA: hypothetical protein VGC06_09230 [Actinomycetes bacterium]